MEHIRELTLRIIQAAALGLIIPMMALLYLAAINERVRRVMLWIMAPLAAFAVLAYVVFAPLKPGSVSSWQEALQVLLDSLVALLPYLMLFAVLGMMMFLFGPSIKTWLRAARHRAARQRYLRAALDQYTAELAGTADLPARSLEGAPSHARLSGASGAGKSVALRQQLVRLARAALADNLAPVPMLVNLDDLPLAGPAGGQSGYGEAETRAWASQAVQVSGAPAMLRREARAGRLFLLADSSQQHFSPAFSQPQERDQRLARLARLVEECDPAGVIMALPADCENGTLLRLLPGEVTFAALDAAEIGQACTALAGAKGTALQAAIQSSSSAWSILAGRVYLLHKLARFYHLTARLPQDIHELFARTLYPAGLPPEALERALGALAAEMLAQGQAQLPPAAAREILLPGGPERQAKGSLARLVQAGLLRINGAGAAVSFGHPLLLAYFTALSWRQGQAITMPAGGPVEAQADPILSDALVFFNNLEGNPDRMTQVLLELAQENTLPALFLAAQCLLALPAAARPITAVEEVSACLAGWYAENDEAAQQFLRLMEPLEPERRAGVIGWGITRLEPARREAAIRGLAEFFQEEIAILLSGGHLDQAYEAGDALVEAEPRLAFRLLCDLLETNPLWERQELAIHLLGRMPDAAARDYLTGLFHAQPELHLRRAILRSLEEAGAELTPLLLELLGGAGEAPELRVLAAQMLAGSQSPQLQAGGVVRELLRISRMPLPEAAREPLLRLLERLHGLAAPAETAGASAAGGDWQAFTPPAADLAGLPPEAALQGSPTAGSRWESLLNPFNPSRPVTEDSLFFGRALELHRLQAAVESASHLLVQGERQVGKTSLLLKLARELRAQAAQRVPVRAVYLDLHGLAAHEFYETVLLAAIEQINDPALVADSNVPRPYTARHFERDLRDVLGFLCGQLGPAARLALLLDGVEALNTYPAEMHAALHRVFENPELFGLVVIPAGSSIPPEGSAEAFYSSYPRLPLGPLSRLDAFKLITQPVRDTFQFEPQALEAIFEASQGYPRRIQALCQPLIDLLLEQGQRAVTPEHVQAAAGQLPDARGELHGAAGRLLDGMLDWVEAHPDAGPEQMEAQVRQAWEMLGKLMVQGVVKTRKQRR